MKRDLVDSLEYAKGICCDGTTSMVLNCICDDMYRKGFDIYYKGRTLYAYIDNKYIKLATIKVYREKIVGGIISSVDKYTLFI